MTTGEKLSKLRKENGYTQEALAEILGVSRQSISKWESDGAFPETEKLIQLSRLYQCTIDYLLKNEVEENNLPILNRIDIKNEDNNIKKYLTKNLFTSIWSLVSFVITLIFYIFPYIRARLFIGNALVSLNVYQLLGSSNYQIGNFIVLLAMILQLSMLILAVFIYIIDNKRLFLIRQVLSYCEAVIWLVLMCMFLDYFQIGQLFMIVSSLANAVGLTIIDKNRYFNEDGSKVSLNNSFYSCLWSIIIYIMYFIIYQNPYASMNNYEHSMFSLITNNLNYITILSIIVIIADLSILVFGVLIGFNKKMHKYRLISSYLSVGLYLIIIILTLISNSFNVEIYLQFGMIFLLIIAIINVIGLKLIRFNKGEKLYE